MSPTQTQTHTEAPPTLAEAEIAALEHEFFDPTAAEHLDAQTLETILGSLLALFPEAPVSALTADGVMIEMPESVPLQRNRVLEARAGVDLIVFDELVMTAWERTLAEGAARCVIHPVAHPELSGMLYMLDLRETHGAIVSVAVYSEEDLAIGLDALDEALDLAPRFATLIKDARSLIVKVDEALTKILGWSAEEMEGRRSLEFIHPDDHGLAVDNWMQMLTVPGPGRRVRLRHRRRDETWVWFEVTNHNMLGDEQNPCVIAEMVDISEEMAAHEELRAREQLLDQLAEAAPVGLLQFDARRDVLYTNDRLHEIVGVSRAQTVAEQLAHVAPGNRKALGKALDEVLGAGRQADIEVELRLPESDELRCCTMGLRALSDESGAVCGAIACVADVTDSVRLREELKKRATFDALTGCHNRASVMAALANNIAAAKPQADRAVVFVDLDRFKEVNDLHGHAIGDELLSIVAQRLRGAVRECDIVGRIGGDEFLVVCPDVGGPGQAMRLAQRMAEAQREKVRLADGGIALQMSIGVAWSSGDSIGAEALVALADRAMYESKRERLGQPKLASGNAQEPTANVGRDATAVARPEADPARATLVAGLAGQPRGDALGGEAPAAVIEHAIEAARQMLGMDMAYLADMRGGLQDYCTVTGDGDSFGAAAGVAVTLEGTYCEKMLNGSLGNIVRDASREPATRALPITKNGRIGAYIGVPVTLSDGRVFGTFCCLSHEPEPALRERDVQFMQVLARLIGDQISRQEAEAEARGLALKASNVSALLSALHARDGYTEDHSQAVVALAIAVGRELRLDSRELLDLESVALLHDIGKIGISDVVLRKPDKLDAAEWVEMHRHPEIGAQIVAAMPSLSYLAPVIRAEHERWDGCGYPNGLQGEEIPLLSRIVFVCDAYHAMTSDRPYRRALGHAAALKEIRGNAGSQFCPQAAAALMHVLERGRAGSASTSRSARAGGGRKRKPASRPRSAQAVKR